MILEERKVILQYVSHVVLQDILIEDVHSHRNKIIYPIMVIGNRDKIDINLIHIKYQLIVKKVSLTSRPRSFI